MLLCMAVLLVLSTFPVNVFAVEGAVQDTGSSPAIMLDESIVSVSDEQPVLTNDKSVPPVSDEQPVLTNDESVPPDDGAQPVLAIGVSAITDCSVMLEFTSNQDGTVHYLIQEASKDAPDVDTLKASETINIAGDASVSINIQGLLSDTAYTVYGIAAADFVSGISSGNFTTAISEQAMPVVSLLAAQLTADGVELTFESDQDGTYYCLIDEEQTDIPDAQTVKEPVEAAVKATGAIASGSALTASVTAELDAEKQYTAYLTVENETGVLSDVQFLPITEPMMLRGILAAGEPDTSWYTVNTSASTFEISTADQLAGLARLLTNTTPSAADGFLGKTIKLTNNIDLSAYQSGSGWVSIGSDIFFSGTFDGNGKTITGLKISGTAGDYSCGLFNTVYGGTIKDLRVENISIQLSGDRITGGFAADLESGIIENCYASGTVSVGEGQYVGGIIGRASGGSIKNCISTVNVIGKMSIGGIVGQLTGSVENCYAAGNITAAASSTYKAGGIAGYLSSSASIRNCAALNAAIIGTTAYSGRIFGDKNSAAVTVNNYASGAMLVNGGAIVGGSADDKDGAPKSGADWLTAAIWGSSGLNWDSGIWNIQDGSLPSLKSFGTSVPSVVISIIQHPEPITNVIEESISGTLSVTVEVTPVEPLSYQWYQNITDSNSGGTEIMGANNSTFPIPATLLTGTYYYFCEVSAGTTSARSNAARVNVSSAADAEAPAPGDMGVLQIVSSFFSPERITVSWTKSTDNISSQTGLKYYVYRSAANNISTIQDCESNGTLLNYGGTSNIDSYYAPWTGAGTSYYFNVVVQDEAGNKAAYQPVLRNGISFTRQPKTATLAAGYISGSLSVTATSAPAETVSYQWYYKELDAYGSPSMLVGETNASYMLPASLAAGDHYYFCKIGIKGDSIWAYSDRAKVTVLAEAVAPYITGPASMTLEEGYAAVSTGSYTVTGTEPIGVPVKTGNAKITWNDTTKKLDIAPGLTAGTYPVTLEVSHPSGKKGTLDFTLTVNPSPVVSITIKTPPAKTAYKDGESLDLTGFSVTLNKNDGNTEVVAFADFGAKGIVTNPANGDTLTAGTDAVTVTANGKTTSQLIIVKFLSPIPGKPTLLEKTASSVTLQTAASASTDAKYRMGTDGIWQDSPSFTGLAPNTDYTFYAQYPETAAYAESPISEGLTVTTNKAALSGTVTLGGTPEYGGELSANTSGLTSVPAIGASNLGALSYQWKRSGTDIIGANNAFYTLVAADIGKTITVTVTAADCEGAITSVAAVAVGKADGPAAPAVTGSYTGNGSTFTYTINSITGAEYKSDSGAWQDSNVFAGIAPLSSQTFYARIKETITQKAGAAGNTGTISFTKLTARPAPVLNYAISSGDFPKIITIAEVSGAEYSFNGGGFGSTYIYTSNHPENVTLSIRLAETDTHKVSPAISLTVNTANQEQASPNGGSSSDESAREVIAESSVPSQGKKPNQPMMAMVSIIAADGVNGTASAVIPDESVTDAITKAQEESKKQGKTANGISVEINIAMLRGTAALTATLTRSSLNSLVSNGVSSLEVNSSFIGVSFDQKALAEIQKQGSGNISITFAPKTNLLASTKAIIGTRPLYDITLSYIKDGKTATVSAFNGGIAIISIPYTPGQKEAAGCLYGVYMDTTGRVTRVEESVYDANAGAVLIRTGHLSVYGVGYTAPLEKFIDTGSHWAKESIDYVVGRGLLTSTFETAFFPDTAMTRGMLVTALGRLAGVDTKIYTANSFTDVKADSVLRPYIEWAYEQGIIQGIGNQQFAPDGAITREEISLILQYYAEATGYTLPVIRDAVIYADASSIGGMYQNAVTAMQQAGIMLGGSGNKFNPRDNVTRAEVSAMLQRYIKLTIDAATTQGWMVNDAGQRLYYKDGKPLTGTQIIGSEKYYFNMDGTLEIGS